jgi:hypothetical protein
MLLLQDTPCYHEAHPTHFRIKGQQDDVIVSIALTSIWKTLTLESTRCSHQRMKQCYGTISRREDYEETALDQIRYDESG